MENFVKETLKQINLWLKWSWYSVIWDIKIEYNDWNNIVSFVISNKF